MKILNWNILQGGGKRLCGVLGVLDEAAADTIVISEFRNNANGAAIQSHLKDSGHIHQVLSSTAPGSCAVFIASKFPFEPLFFKEELGCEAARCSMACFDDLNLFGFYFAQKELQKPLFEFILSLPVAFLNSPTILIGDYNAGKHYLDEEGKTLWGAHYMEKLEQTGWIDGWRHLHQETKEFTWFSNHGNGFRIDHAFFSKPALDRLESIEYFHAPRENKISDHSALICELRS